MQTSLRERPHLLFKIYAAKRVAATRVAFIPFIFYGGLVSALRNGEYLFWLVRLVCYRVKS